MNANYIARLQKRQKLTRLEQDVLNRNIDNQIAEKMKQLNRGLTTIVLWTLHEEYGFGEKRLKRFCDSFYPRFKKLIDFYEAEDSDACWLCEKMLENAGYDVDKIIGNGGMKISYEIKN